MCTANVALNIDAIQYAYRPGYNHGAKHHRGMGHAGTGNAEEDALVAQAEEDTAIEDLKQMRADLDEKLAKLEMVEKNRNARRANLAAAKADAEKDMV